MTAAFLSIVTISFNQKDFLRQTLDSVISQKTDDVEYIVVDPGSTDGSRDLLLDHAGDIDILILDPDNGPADGLNKGFAKVSGEVGYFLNSDDFLLPGAITSLRRCWSRAGDADIVLGGGWMVSGDCTPLRQMRATRTDMTRLLDGRASLFQQGMSFRMERFRRAGGFNAGNRTCWDLELLLDMMATGAGVRTVTSQFGVFRLHGDSLSGGAEGSAHNQRYRSDMERLQAKYGDASRPGYGRAASLACRLIENPALVQDVALARFGPAIMSRRWLKANQTHDR